ncbi:MAG: hypothetical protein J3K34DRAFT_433473 [Monoraphidium minutum]|nr:MAG: hypothetical protein J3K34DRAFT_433473 [Monoraphidium minutum]
MRNQAAAVRPHTGRPAAQGGGGRRQECGPVASARRPAQAPLMGKPQRSQDSMRRGKKRVQENCRPKPAPKTRGAPRSRPPPAPTKLRVSRATRARSRSPSGCGRRCRGCRGTASRRPGAARRGLTRCPRHCASSPAASTRPAAPPGPPALRGACAAGWVGWRR